MLRPYIATFAALRRRFICRRFTCRRFTSPPLFLPGSIIP